MQLGAHLMPRLCAFLPLAAATGLLLFAGCVKEISSEERLERETRTVPLDRSAGALELDKLACNDVNEALALARDVNRPETQRVQDYMELYVDLRRRTQAFEDAMLRNPDLQYQEGSQKYAEAREVCVQQTADIRVEFERYVRELVELPTVQELKGGSTVTVARLSFDTLRQAIEALDVDDKDVMLSRVASAEKRIEAAGEEKPEPRRRGR
jgi:hypothetical protein